MPMRRLLSSPLAAQALPSDLPRLQSTPTSAANVSPANRLISAEAPHVRFAPSSMLVHGTPVTRFPNVSTAPTVSRASFTSGARTSPIAISRESYSPANTMARVSPFATRTPSFNATGPRDRVRNSPLAPTRTVTVPSPANISRPYSTGPVRAVSPTANYSAIYTETSPTRVTLNPMGSVRTSPLYGGRTSPLQFQQSSPPSRTSIASNTSNYMMAQRSPLTSSPTAQGRSILMSGSLSPSHGVSYQMAASPTHRGSVTTATISSPMRPSITRATTNASVSPISVRREEVSFGLPPSADPSRATQMATYTVPSVMYAASPNHTMYAPPSSPVGSRRTVLSPMNVVRGSVVPEPTGWIPPGATTMTSPTAMGHRHPSSPVSSPFSRKDYLANLQAKLGGYQSAGLTEQIDEEKRNLRKGVRMAPRDPKFTARLEKLSELRYQRAFAPGMDVTSRMGVTADENSAPQIRIVPPANKPFLQPQALPTASWRAGRRVELGPEEHAALKKIYSMDGSTLSIISRSVSQPRSS